MTAINSIFANKKRLTITIILIIAAAIGVYYFYLKPLNNEKPVAIGSGQDFIVTVYASEVQNLYGYQFNLYYDNEKVSFKGGLKSSIDAIGTIFKKDKEEHMLVGATMIGDVPGFSGKNVEVCSLEFTANSDIDSSMFVINRVNTVDADQNYLENVSGWSVKVKVKTE
ncbi:MAG TPA: hypothetical protein GX505_02425 [Clostridiales bacterium]|nr:hypothetical protein [Clostridiales bacterium]